MLPELPDASPAVGLTALTALDHARTPASSHRPAAGAGLVALLDAAPQLRRDIVDSGSPLGVARRDLATWSYPTSFAFGGAVRTPMPSVRLLSRMLVVQWADPQGVTRTLLWEPADHERAGFTPYYARRRAGLGRSGPARTVVHGTVPGHLRALGIDPGDVDYLAFAHLQTQDVRRLLGTTAPAPDLADHDTPLEGWFPNATLLVARQEWEALARLHPLQAPWYQPRTFTSLPGDRVGLLDGDRLLGPGVALIATPGRTGGHTSLVLATEAGVWVCSGNGVAADAWAPRASRLPGLRAWSLSWGQEVAPVTDGSEFAAWQYDAMMLEGALADPVPSAPFPQCLPTAELAAGRRSPGLGAAHRQPGPSHGRIHGSSPVASA